MVSVQDCIRANETAIRAMRQAIDRLEVLRRDMTDNAQARIDSRIQRTENEITLLETINVHLRASVVQVAPMNANVEATLRRLESALDDAIRRDAILTASLETAIDVIDAAKGIRAIVDDHS